MSAVAGSSSGSGLLLLGHCHLLLLFANELALALTQQNSPLLLHISVRCGRCTVQRDGLQQRVGADGCGGGGGGV